MSKLFTMILKRPSLAKSVVGRVGHFLAGGLNRRPLNFPPIIRIALHRKGYKIGDVAIDLSVLRS